LNIRAARRFSTASGLPRRVSADGVSLRDLVVTIAGRSWHAGLAPSQ
jgi:hypothetical protein